MYDPFCSPFLFLFKVREVSVIASARVPIVKFVHTATSIQVDISFDLTSGLESGAAAKELMSNMQQVLRKHT